LRKAAAPHFSNGKIAFESTRTGNREVFLMNPDGTNQVNISNNPAADGNPAWSFDGTKIAFNSNRDGDAEIYVMNGDGTNQTRLTTSNGTDATPAFSPDGTKIVFHSNRTGNFEIFLMNADGSNQTQLTNAPGNDLSAVFSPDGSKIAFTSNRDGNAEIYIMNADGSNQTRLTNDPELDQAPAYSPNGKKIAFQRLINANQIMVMNADGSNQTQLTSGSAAKFDPSFSADGNSISFSSVTANEGDIFIMKADGTGQNQITNSVGNDIVATWQWLPGPDTIGVYRPSTSQFLLRNSTTAGSPNETVAFGQVGDLPVAGDWNGDGQDTQGVFRNGQFLLRQPTTVVVPFHPPVVVNITLLVNFGQAGDLPVVGDWNGDGIDTVGVFRPSTGQWRLTNSANTNNSSPPADLLFNFGSAGDAPVAGDWDGDGRDSIGTFNAGSWALRNSNSAGAADITVLFGTAPGARPVVGDWNGDGVDTIGVLLPSNVFGATTFGLNNVNANLTGSFDILAAFGADGDLPDCRRLGLQAGEHGAE
jgi:Tol biopolymer transport system component